MAWTPPSSPDRVLVWSSQLAANDFPPVCAMTGAPAETWRKFRFSTAPAWAAAFFLLLCTGVGLLIVFIVIYAVSRRATGHLPLSKAGNQRVSLASWIPAGLITAAFAVVIMAVVGAGLSSTSSSHVTSALVYTNWVSDATSTGGPHPGFKPAFTGLTGDDVTSAGAVLDATGTNWVVNIVFSSKGAALFDTLTRANVAACGPDPTAGQYCAQRFLTIWLDLTQKDINSWDDPNYQAKLLVPYDAACVPSDNVTCGKLLVDAVTLSEISGGRAQILAGNSTQQGADDLVTALNVTTTTTSPIASAIAWTLGAVALLMFLAGVVWALVIRRFIGPRGKVMQAPPGYTDHLVELRNVHQAFVSAVLQTQQARAAQYSSMYPSQSPPLAPGSN